MWAAVVLGVVAYALIAALLFDLAVVGYAKLQGQSRRFTATRWVWAVVSYPFRLIGRADYRACTVTVWVEDETKPKGVRPEQVNVLAWIASRVAAKNVDELAGIASCAALMRQRIARRNRC